MESFGMPNAYYPAGPGAQRAPQPFLPPNGYPSLGQLPMPPPTLGPAPSARIIPASLLHGPYAAGYYTYTPGPQPQYQYHPAYSSTYDCNQGYPRQFQGTPMAPHPNMLYSATGSPSFGANLTTEDNTPMLAFNNPMSMRHQFQKNNPVSTKTDNLGPSQLRNRNHGRADTSSSATKGLLKPPKATFMEALKSSDVFLKKADKYADGLSKDDDVSKAVEKPLSDIDVFGGSRLTEEVKEMIRNGAGKHVKALDALNENMKKVRLNTTAGRKQCKQTVCGKPSQVEPSLPASGPKKLMHSEHLGEENISNVTATYDKDGPSKPSFRSASFAPGPILPSHSHPGMFPRPCKGAGAANKVADTKPVFFDLDEVNLATYDAMNSDGRGSSSDDSSSAGMATPEECSVHELEDQFFDLLDELTQLHLVWLTGTPKQRAAISAKAKEMMQVGFSARGDTCGKKGGK